MLKRKIDAFLTEWKGREHKPLIVKGARQIGKTESVRHFAASHYEYIIEINFVLQPQYLTIFENGYEVDTIIKAITLRNPMFQFEPGKTLVFFDELQQCPACATSLKSFCQDGRYDVICSGSLMGISYKEIESVSVGYKEDYEMHALDFEEFLWARGYGEAMIDDLYSHMVHVQPFAEGEMKILMDIFQDYMIVGGMPEVVNRFVEQGNFSGTLTLQRQLLKDYEEDITKYAQGLDKGKILAIYNHISTFLAKENKKFQITKVARNARTRDYAGTVEWLASAGIVNVCYLMEVPELPLKGNYSPKDFKLYYHDNGLLIASLDDEAQEDLRNNRNFATYKGAIYENIVASMLVAQHYGLYYFKNEKSTIEMDFFVRDAESLIPVEVKANNGASASLNNLIDKPAFSDIKYGIKLGKMNIGFNDKFYSFPYFLAFLLKRFLKEGK